jgi:hypothetical protein
MSLHAAEILRRFDQLDRVLVSKGFPPTSPWWRRTIERWYCSGKKQLVLRAGRRAGKSSTFTRLAVVEAIYGNHAVPPGDIGVVAIISARRTEALERLRTVKAILDAINMKYDERGDTVELKSRRVSFNVYTATIAGVSGFTGIFILCDEVAKWRDSDTGANPAQQVIVSVRPTVATQPEARIALSSSPMGLLDAHADAYALGDTPLQTTAHATTWEANPTVSEAYTRTLEPDEVVWLREYKAIPQAENELSLLTDQTLSKLVRAPRSNYEVLGDGEPLLGPNDTPYDERHRYVATIDPATRGNAWTLAITTLSDDHVRKVVLTREWRGTKKKPLVPGQVFAEIAPLLRIYKLRHVHSDQFAEDSMREIARQHDVYLVVDVPWSAGTKADAYDGLLMLTREGRFEIPPDVVVKNDLLGIRTKMTRNGIIYELATQGPRHSDYAPCIAMGIMLTNIPPVPRPQDLTDRERAEVVKNTFLRDRERERKRSEKQGRLPPTHR